MHLIYDSIITSVEQWKKNQILYIDTAFFSHFKDKPSVCDGSSSTDQTKSRQKNRGKF